jgi:hypothetical protein
MQGGTHKAVRVMVTESFARVVLMMLLCYVAAAMGKQTRAIPSGMWGGDHAVLELTDKGGEIEFDCARGHLDEPLRVDADGRFDVKGTFTPEHAGPIRRNENPAQSDTRYTGQIVGTTMTLKIIRGGTDLGSFTLVRGARPILKKCR